MFEKATRLKLRFESTKGLLTTEDLWDLPLNSAARHANLNDVARAISRELKDSSQEDFVSQKTPENDVLQLKMDIVKHVIAVRLAEADAAKQAAARREKKERLLGLIEQKQNEQLGGKSLEELQAMVAEL
jgi:hypothetical protein